MMRSSHEKILIMVDKKNSEKFNVSKCFVLP